MTPKTQATATNWILSKLKLLIKNTIKKVKRPPSEQEKILANYISDKSLVSTTHKEF